MTSGKRPAVRSVETCASTFGLLGAESSLRTSHFGGSPVCVMATLQPGGATPGVASSKRITSAQAHHGGESRITISAERLSVTIARGSATSLQNRNHQIALRYRLSSTRRLYRPP